PTTPAPPDLTKTPAGPSTGKPATGGPATPAEPPPRRPIPQKADQTRSRTIFRQAFVKELADRSPTGRRALTERLLAEGARAADNPSDQFVLFAGAHEAAREAGSLPLCFRAADLMADAFEGVDPIVL